MPVRPNRVKEMLAAGETVYSTSVRLPEPGLCEILGYAGFDFVLIDGEHGGIDLSAVDTMVQGCFAGGTVPCFRVVNKDDDTTIMKVLDLGVQGILIPHCCTADDARRLKRAALYAPQGNRGFGPGRGMKWGQVSVDDYFRTINDTVFLFALIEDLEGVENIEAIAAEGLDCLWVGTGDLAMAYGLPGQRQAKPVMDAAAKILETCKRHNVACGYPAGDADEARWAAEQGYRLIGYGGAESYVMRSSQQFLNSVRGNG